MIGENTSIGSDFVVSCLTHICIGKNVLIADRCLITDCEHEYRDPERPVKDQGMRKGGGVTVGDGSWIGINSVILPGVTIGENAVVGANSVVTRNVPPRTVVAGVPAKIVKAFDVQLGLWIRLSERDGER